MFDFIKRKTKDDPEGLERAKQEQLISEEEFWELQIKRAEKKLKELKEKKK